MKLIIIITALFLSTLSDISAIDKKPVKQQKKSAKKTEISGSFRSERKTEKTNKKINGKNALQKNINSAWEVQFAYDVTIGSGTETDGNYFYVSQWNMDSIYKFSMTGEPAGAFSISPVSGIRDLAYDGIYFYGSDASNKIYKMNFTTEQIVDSITCPAYITIRHIAYDIQQNAFWVGDWDTDIYLVNQTGQVIDMIPQVNFELNSMYGSAYDNITSGGPYLWIFDQGGYGCDLAMIKISSGELTGILHDCTSDAGADLFEPIAGGLFIAPNLIPGTVTIGGIMQGQKIFGYNLQTLISNIDVGIEKIISPTMQGSCSLSNQEEITVQIRNFGLTTAANFSVHLNLNNTNYSMDVPGPLNSFQPLTLTFPGTFDFSAPDVYDFTFNTLYSSDQNSTNDTIFHRLITGNGILTVNVLPDSFPNETHWEVFNNFNYNLYGYPLYYMEPGVLQSTEVCVDTNLCYAFSINDSYGDGIFVPGYFEVIFNNELIEHVSDFSSDYYEIPYIGNCDYADIGVTALMSPVSSCFLGYEEFITVIVKNFGTQTVTNPEISFSLNGTMVTEEIPYTLDSQEEVEFTFVNLCDMSALGDYELLLYTQYSSDANPFNDTLRYSIQNYIPASMPYSVNFENDSDNNQLLVENENGDGFTWYLSNTGGINNSSCAYYAFNPNEPANDWLFTKCIEMEAGTDYQLEFFYKVQSGAYPENLKVHLCDAPSSSAAATESLINLTTVIDEEYTAASVIFSVPETGNYFLGWNVYSDLNSWNLFIDNLSVSINTLNLKNTTDKVSVYPNPAKNIVTISATSEIKQIKLFSVYGQLLNTFRTDNSKTSLNISDVPTGMYFIQIETASGLFNKNIIIE